MAQIFQNNAETTLALQYDGGSTLEVADSSEFPSLAGGGYFNITLVQEDVGGSEVAWEILKISYVSGNTFSVEARAQEGTTPRTWPVATRVSLRLTASAVQRHEDHVTLSGNPHGTTAAQVGADPVGTATTAVAAHVGQPDPHSQYTTQAEAESAATAAVAAHVGQPDPHSQYTTQAEAESAATAAVTAHVAQSDPHSQYTTASEASAAAPVQSVAGKTGAVVLVKADVGLSQVDNTADLSKPVSTLMQAALDAKRGNSDVIGVAQGGTGATDAAGARSALGLANHEKVVVDGSGGVIIPGITQLGANAALNNGAGLYHCDPGTTTWVAAKSPTSGVLRWFNASKTLMELTPTELQVGGSIRATGTNNKLGKVLVRDDSLEVPDGDVDGVSLNLNYYGYASGAARSRDVTIFNGKGGRIAQFFGSDKRVELDGALQVGGGARFADNLGIGVTLPAMSGYALGTQRAFFGALHGGPYNHGYMSANCYPTGSSDPAHAVWKYLIGASGDLGGATLYEQRAGDHIFKVATPGTAGSAISWTQGMTLDASGNLLVGVGSSSTNSIGKVVAADAGNLIFQTLIPNVGICARFYGVSSGGASSINTALLIYKDAITARSISTAGTINASGADYAEYERRRNEFIGKILKGAIVGFDVDGKLTLSFDEAISFGVKSTDPCMVGGDVWGTEEALGMKRPEQPQDDASDDDKAAYQKALAKFEAALEAARQQVDRIAYSGKVPCNVYDAKPGDYIVAVRDIDGGIAGVAVAKPTFEQYQNTVGRVRRIEADGRANIAVMVH